LPRAGPRHEGYADQRTLGTSDHRARLVDLHEDLVSEVEDELAPSKQPDEKPG